MTPETLVKILSSLPDSAERTELPVADLRALIAAYEAQQRVISLAHDVALALGGSSEILSILNSPHDGYDEMERQVREWLAENGIE